jgi:hypothetical protein
MKKSQYLKLIESLDSSRNREVVTEYNPTGEHDWPNQGWWKSKEDKAKGMTTDQLNYAQKDCHAAGRANPDNEGKYSDEGSVYARQLAANAKRAKRAKGKRAKTEGLNTDDDVPDDIKRDGPPVGSEESPAKHRARMAYFNRDTFREYPSSTAGHRRGAEFDKDKKLVQSPVPTISDWGKMNKPKGVRTFARTPKTEGEASRKVRVGSDAPKGK